MLARMRPMGTLLYNRRVRLALLAIVPVVLYLVFAEQMSWRPRTFTHADYVTLVRFSPDGKTLAAAVSETGVMLWDINTATPIRSLKIGAGTTHSIEFSPSGDVLASGGSSSTIEGEAVLQLWDWRTGKLKHTLQPQGNYVMALGFSSDGKTLISASGRYGGIQFWDVQKGTLLKTLKWYRDLIIPSLAVSTDSKLLVTGVESNGIMLWSLPHAIKIREWQLPDGGEYPPVAFAPRAISGIKDILAIGSGDYVVGLWNPDTGKLVRKLPGHTDEVRSVAFSPDGSLLASSSMDGTTRVWQPATGQLLRLLKANRNEINSVSFSPDSRTLAVASAKTVKLWRIK